MASFIDLCRFVPTLGGTTDFIYSSAVGGCQSPAAANALNGVKYKCYAVSNDLTQWEIFEGVYNSSTGTFPRTTVLYNSSGTGYATGQSGAGTKISFSTVPQVSIIAAAEDLLTGFINAPSVLSNRTHQYDSPSATGTNLSQNVRRAHQAPATTSIADIQLAFGNWYVGISGTITEEFPNFGALNDINVEANIEYPAGTYFAVYFGGSRLALIGGGATMYSNPVGVEIPAGATYFTNTLVFVGSTSNSWPVMGGTSGAPYAEAQTQSSMGEGASSSASVVNSVNPGSAITASNSIAYGPCLILSRGVPRVPSVVLFGDSIGDGYGEGTGYTPAGSTDPNGLTGYLQRAMQNTVGSAKFTRPGDSYTFRVPTGNHQASFAALAGGVSHAVCGLGTNDVNALAQSTASVQASAAAFWSELANRGIKVWACTIPPCTTSTDNWLTTANQTVVSTEATRVALNTWIRTKPAPLTGYFDVADALETSRNSGIWKIFAGQVQGYTIDGTHCSTFGYKQGATAINPLLL